MDNHSTRPILYGVCTIHEEPYSYLSTDPQQENVFKCSECIYYNFISKESCIPIKSILQNKEQSPIQKNISIQVHNAKESITNYFKQFLGSFIQRIQVLETSISNKLQNITNKISKKVEKDLGIDIRNEIHAIIADPSKSEKQKSIELKPICSQLPKSILDQSCFDNNKEIINQINLFSTTFNIDSLNALKDSLLSRLDSIDIFMSQDFSEFDQLKLKTSSILEEVAIKKIIDEIGKNLQDNISEQSEIQPQKEIDETSIAIISEEQQNSLQKLALKMAQLNQVNKNDNKTSKKLDANIQNNSALIKKKIIDRNVSFDQDNVIEDLLIKYPIFELIPDIPPSYFSNNMLHFEKTGYRHSKSLIINSQSDKTTLSSSKNSVTQAVSRLIDNDKAYRVKIKFNQPYGRTKAIQGFMFGLVNNSDKDSKFIAEAPFTGLYTRTQGPGHRVSRKGDVLLTDENVKNNVDELEFRFCVRTNDYFAADASYSIIEQNCQSLNFKEAYRFGITFYMLVEDDWIISVTDFSEIDPSELRTFNGITY